MRPFERVLGIGAVLALSFLLVVGATPTVAQQPLPMLP